MRHFNKIRINAVSVFIITFALCLVVQAASWSVSDPLDRVYWTSAIEKRATGQEIKPDLPAFGYPGTTLIVPGSMLVNAGMEKTNALLLLIQFWLSFITALCAVVSFLIRPKSIWWLIGSFQLMITSMYFYATPPSIIIVPMIALMVLLALYIFENTGKNKDRAIIAFIIASALSIATRFDVAGLLFVLSLIFIYPKEKERLAHIVGATAITSFIFTPLMWHAPIQYILDVLDKMFYTGLGQITTSQPIFQILGNSPVATASFGILVLCAIFYKDAIDLPRRFVLWLIALVVITWTTLMGLRYHPDWYFFPIFGILEMFFSFFILNIASMTKPVKAMPSLTPRLVCLLLIGIPLGYQLCQLLLHVLHLMKNAEMIF